MIFKEPELAALEEHVLVCPACAVRADETQDYVDAVRAAIVVGRYDYRVASGVGPSQSWHRAATGLI